MGSASLTILFNGVQNALRKPLLGLSVAGLLSLGLSTSVHADLPDFTELVKKNEAAVVNISTVGEQPDRRSTGAPTDPRLEEFYRFFGPPNGRGARVTVGLPILAVLSAADSSSRKTVIF
jgi:S1-C subfamily serine protease